MRTRAWLPLLVVAACSKSSGSKPAAREDAAPTREATAPTYDAKACTFGNQEVMTLEPCVAACEDEDMEACAVAASLLSSPRYVAEPERARAYRVRACDEGIGQACRSLARTGPEARAFFARAMTAFERGCAAGDGASCMELSAAYDDDDGFAPDRAKVVPTQQRALAAWEAGCDRGDGPSCERLYLEYSLGRIVAGDERKAQDYALRGCEVGHAASCKHAGGSFDLFAADPKRAARALELYAKACDLGLGIACVSLGIRKDHDLALFDRACALRCNEGCDAAGEASRDRDPAGAAARYRQSCERGHRASCRGLERLGHLDAGAP